MEFLCVLFVESNYRVVRAQKFEFFFLRLLFNDDEVMDSDSDKYFLSIICFFLSIASFRFSIS